MLTATELHTIHSFQSQNNLKNESQAIGMILVTYNRLQNVISALEKQAHEAEEWKSRAEKKDGINTKHIIAKNAKKNTELKAQSVENTKNIRKQGGKH